LDVPLLPGPSGLCRWAWLANRPPGAIGRRLGLPASHILLNTSHTHCGPAVGTWAYADYRPPGSLYLSELEAASVEAACRARENVREATLWAGQGRTALSEMSAHGIR